MGGPEVATTGALTESELKTYGDFPLKYLAMFLDISTMNPQSGEAGDGRLLTDVEQAERQERIKKLIKSNTPLACSQLMWHHTAWEQAKQIREQAKRTKVAVVRL